MNPVDSIYFNECQNAINYENNIKLNNLTAFIHNFMHRITQK